MVAVAAGHQPTRDVRDFLRRLRAALPPAAPVVVTLAEVEAGGGLRDAEADEFDVWRRALAALDDPYLWVEALGEER